MYNYSHIAKPLEKAIGIFTGAFIKLNSEELILDREFNIYFRLDNVTEIIDFDCKMIAYLSRPAHKGKTKKIHKYFLDAINKYFNKKWTNDDMSIIYTYLGNDCNRELCKKFLCSNFDISLLKRREK